MSRRSLISITAIKRIISATNRRNREEHNNELIRLQGTEKECAPQYTLKSVDFNLISRITRIEILKTQEYRTIQRYVTQNYQRYPIYSDWKTKEKIIKKTIKLTNSELETLNFADDDLIRMLAEKIIIELNNEELFPSWFLRKYLKKELDYDLQTLKDDLDTFVDEQNKNILNQQLNIHNFNLDITDFKKTLKMLQNRKNKLTTKLKKLSNSKKNIFKSIFSFGIYNYLISNKRKNKLKSKLSACESYNIDLDKKILNIQNEIKKCNDTISNFNIDIKNKEEEYEKERQVKLNIYNEKISNVKPLSNTISKDNKFIMLKYLNGLEYEKIIGVYIIHNIEKDKYYVGQSKDVIKRIKQHFTGTTPKNVIFAEDYYTSNIDDRNDLFEFKIIKCNTKDELDRLEKELIYQYDSWNNGYNGTSGNI